MTDAENNPNVDSQGARTETSHSILPLIIILAKRIKFLVFVPLFFGLVALVYSMMSDPIYTATTRLLPPQYNENTVTSMQNQLGGESQLGNSALNLKDPTDLFVGILNSRTIMDGLIDNHDLLNYYGISDKYRLRQKLISSTKIRVGKDGIVTILVNDKSKEKAADIANAYVLEFYNYSRNLAVQEASRRSQFYEKSLNNARMKLETSEMALLKSEKESGFTRLSGQDQAIVQAAAELQAQISARKIQLDTMSVYATRSNPDYILIARELKNLENQLNGLQGSNTKLLKGIEIDPSESDANKSPFVTISNAPDALLEHTRRKRDVSYWETIVLLLGKYNEFGKIDERRDMSLFQVLDHAIAPEEKSSPRTKVNVILAVIASGFLALMWVLVTEYIRERRKRSAHFNEQWQLLIEGVLPKFLSKRLLARSES